MAASSSIKERVAQTRFGRIACLEAGDGEALLLLHGIGSSARSFAAQLEGLADRRRVIAWNAPGYAGSDHLAADAPDVQDYAEAAVALLDSLGVERCDLVGTRLAR